jgi:HEAT repeat protein
VIVRASLAALLLLLPLQESPEALVRRLGSDSLGERDGAERALRALGPASLPALDAAAKDADAEVAVRAGRISRSIRLLAEAPPELARRYPFAAERLSSGGDGAWASLLLEIARGLTKEDKADGDLAPVLLYLLPRSLRHPLSGEEFGAVIGALLGCDVRAAGPFLVPFLEHPNEEIADHADGALRSLGNIAVLGPLRDLLRRPDPKLRTRIADVLSDFDHPEAAAACLPLLRDPSPEVRFTALAGLRAYPGRAVRDAVEACLIDRDADVRRTAVQILSSLRHPASIPRLVERLGDADADVREAALGALGSLRAAGAEPSLLALLNDPEPGVRRAAVSALLSLGSPAAVAPVLAGLKDGGELGPTFRWLNERPIPQAAPLLLRRMKTMDDDSRENAERILERCAGPELLPELRLAAADPKDPRRPAALGLLGSLGAPAAEPELLKALADPDPALRRRAIASLPAAGLAVHLLPLLEDPDAGVRAHAVGRLRGLPVDEHLPRVIALLKDPSDDVVDQAIDVLAARGWPPARLPLLGVVDRATDEDLRRKALQQALQLSGPSDAAELLPRMADRDLGVLVFELLPELGAAPEVLAKALRAVDEAPEDRRILFLSSLSNWDAPALAARIRPLLRSRSSAERAAAAEAVAGLRAWSLVDDVAALVDDPAPEVRGEAFRVLRTLDASAIYPAARKLAAAGPADLRREALEELAEDPSPESRDLLRRLSAEPHSPFAGTALFALAERGDAETALPRLRELLRLGRPGERLEAARLRPLLGGPDAATDLVHALDDSDPDVRMTAVRGLSRLRAAAAIPRLEEALDDPSGDVRDLALGALMACGSPTAARTAADRLRHPDASVRLAAAAALRDADPTRHRAALLDLLSDADLDIRHTAAVEAAASGDPRMQELVLRLLQDPWDPLRRTAAWQAGRRRIPGATEPLLRALEVEDRSERGVLVYALAQLADPAAAPLLRKLLDDTAAHWPRRSVAFALAQCGDAGGVPFLLRGRASFLTLNAVRRGEQWRRLNRLPVEGAVDGDLHAGLRRLAALAGLELEVSPSAAEIRLRRSESSDDGAPRWWTDELTRLCGWDVAPVLEEQSLRILTRAEAREFWFPWWEAESKRLGGR